MMSIANTLQTGELYTSSVQDFFDLYGAFVHKQNRKWWTDLATGEPIRRNKGEMIALMHSELSEMLEGVRKNSMDDHLPHLSSEVVELADLIVRALDYAAGHSLPLGQAIVEKVRYNATRADHSVAVRMAAGGKRF